MKNKTIVLKSTDEEIKIDSLTEREKQIFQAGKTDAINFCQGMILIFMAVFMIIYVAHTLIK